MENWFTTVTGALSGLGYYLGTVGAQVPKSKGEWINFGVGALLAVLGYGAKDASTRVKP